MGYENSNKKARAEKRVKELKGFFVHLLVYVIVNTMLSLTIVVSNMQQGKGFFESFWEFGTFSVWFFWGIGLFSHGIKVFSYNPFFSKEWEERQIQKFMEEDRKASQNNR